MKHTDPKKREIKEIGKSYHIIFSKRKANENGFNKGDEVELTIEKNE